MNVEFFAIRNSAVAFYFIEPSPCYAVVLMPHNMDIMASGKLVKEIGTQPFFLLNVFTIEGKKPTIQQLMDLPVDDYQKILDIIEADNTNLNDLFKK
jgi:hypothetical protein